MIARFARDSHPLGVVIEVEPAKRLYRAAFGADNGDVDRSRGWVVERRNYECKEDGADVEADVVDNKDNDVMEEEDDDVA